MEDYSSESWVDGFLCSLGGWDVSSVIHGILFGSMDRSIRGSMEALEYPCVLRPSLLSVKSPRCEATGLQSLTTKDRWKDLY